MKSKRVIFTLSILAVVLGIVFWPYPEPQQTTETAKPVYHEVAKKLTDEDKAQKLLELTNAKRLENNLKPLDRMKALDVSATRKAKQMADENQFGHVDKSGRHGYEYIADETDMCSLYGSENISRNITVEGTFENWLNSPGHRAAILDPRYEYIGVGIHDNLHVLHFCDSE